MTTFFYVIAKHRRGYSTLAIFKIKPDAVKYCSETQKRLGAEFDVFIKAITPGLEDMKGKRL